MADRQRLTFTPFKKGDQVWLDSRNMKTIYHKKMKPKWEGPFVITDVLWPVTCRLELLTSWQIHNVFHASYSNHTGKMKSTGKTSLNHLLNWLREKRSTKSKLFVITGNRDEDINIMSSGRVILFPTPHGNRNMHFLMMATYWLNTKNATTFNFSFVSILTHVSLSTVQHGWRTIGLLRDQLWSHCLLGQFKTCTGNGRRPDFHYPPTFQPLQNHWKSTKLLTCLHPPLTTLLSLPSCQLSLEERSHLTQGLEWWSMCKCILHPHPFLSIPISYLILSYILSDLGTCT